MATIYSDVSSDGTPMTSEQVFMNVPQPKSRPASAIFDAKSVRGAESSTLYSERKWDSLDPYEYIYDKIDPGYVMIINQREFTLSTSREGTDFDVEEIIKCFGRQGYNLAEKNIITNSTRNQLLVEVNRVCEEELANTNSLIVFVMSHGELDNKFYVYDDVVTIQELVDPFLKVESFSDKPKIFIFQTCKTNAEQRQNHTKEDIKLYVNTTLTSEPNLLMYCSTLEGDYSYRDQKRGSWFIQELCRNIYSYGHREEIQSILMRCNKCLARNYYYENESKAMNEKQTPLFISTLMKNFYICRSKDRYFYINKMNELRESLKKTDELLQTMTLRRRTLY